MKVGKGGEGGIGGRGGKIERGLMTQLSGVVRAGRGDGYKIATPSQPHRPCCANLANCEPSDRLKLG